MSDVRGTNSKKVPGTAFAIGGSRNPPPANSEPSPRCSTGGEWNTAWKSPALQGMKKKEGRMQKAKSALHALRDEYTRTIAPAPAGKTLSLERKPKAEGLRRLRPDPRADCPDVAHCPVPHTHPAARGFPRGRR